MEKLTLRQEEMLKVVKKFIAKHGYSPTVREIGDIMGLNSSATVFVHLKNLIAKGYLSQTSSKFRTLDVLVPNEYEKKNENNTAVPLIGNVSAGNPIEAIERPCEYFYVPSHMIPKNSEVFTLLVKGDSMINAGINDKDILVVKKTSVAKNRDIIVALLEDNTVTLKRYFKEDNHFRLQPENDNYSPIILNDVVVLGIAVGLYRNF
ncbi:MAG: transcriptional repressor LexA [Bacilli bacterium]